MQKIENREELINRLIANKFSFSYNKGDNTICLTQGGRLELTDDNAIGYHYVGYVDERLFNIGDEPIESIIGDAFEKYIDLVADYVESKMNDLADKMFGNIAGV